MTHANVCARDGCGRALRPNQPYTYREVIAMEQVSRTGGAGPLKAKEYTGRVFCGDCAVAQPAVDLFGAAR